MKVLLLDAAFSAIPIYEYLVDAGHDVFVMGNRPHDVLARKAGSRWIDQDYSKPDEVRPHLARHGIESVVPGCTDISIETCAKLGLDSYPLDSFENNAILGDKAAFRRLCSELDLPAPRVVDDNCFPAAGRFICKPVDSFSGRGVTIFDGMDVDALKEARRAAVEASPSATALVETFASGGLYSCSAFIENQKLVESFYVLEGSSANPYAVDTSYVVDDVPAACRAKLSEGLERLCGALSLRDGLLHTQFILADGGDPYIIEIARRCPGDLYSLLIEYSTGFRYAAKYASYFLNAHETARIKARRYVLRHTVTSADKYEIFAGLRMTGASAVRAFFPLGAVGHELLPNQRSRAGVLFCEASDYDQLIADYDRFIARDAYQVG